MLQDVVLGSESNNVHMQLFQTFFFEKGNFFANKSPKTSVFLKTSIFSVLKSHAQNHFTTTSFSLGAECLTKGKFTCSQ